MTLLDLELGRHGWGSMTCGCGQTAAHLVTDLYTLARAQDDEEVSHIDLQRHLVDVDTILEEPASAVASVALAAISGPLSEPALYQFLSVLRWVTGAEGQAPEVPEGRDILAECEATVRAGLWTLYSQVAYGQSNRCVAAAFGLLAWGFDDPEHDGQEFDVFGYLLRENKDRVLRLQTALDDRLPSVWRKGGKDSREALGADG